MFVVNDKPSFCNLVVNDNVNAKPENATHALVPLNHILVVFACDDSHALRLDASSPTVTMWVSLKTNQHALNRYHIES